MTGQSDNPPASATLLVGGPTGGGPERTARLLAPLLAPTLFGPAPDHDPTDEVDRVDVTATGGRDGVTAANAFETRASADGSTALVVPGEAVLAWLAGDPRCHFDAGTWVPAFATVAPVALVGRLPPAREDRAVVLGGGAPTGPMLPGLIALTMLGIPIRPRFGLAPDDVTAALRSGAIDLAVLSGADVPSRAAGLAADGIPTAIALRPDGTRDSAVPGAPAFNELLAARGRDDTGPLASSRRASTAAAALDAALVLPALAPAGVVARWRAACDDASRSLAFNEAAAGSAVRPVPAPECVDAVRAVVAGADGTLALRKLLAGRWGWSPA